MVAEVAKKAGVHCSTVYRWIERFECTGRVSSLVALEHDGGRGKPRVSEEHEAILQAVIADKYLQKQKLKVSKVYEFVEEAFKNAKLKLPHINTLRNRINAISQRTKDEARLGSEIAAKRHSAYPGKIPGGDFPLAVGQIDHALMDVCLLDDRDREPIGRPWITVLIDIFSRMVLGYFISLDKPNAMSTAMCVANAMLPKESLLAKFGIKAQWPCWGALSKIHADNAREFRGNTLKRSCKEYSTDLEWRPVKQPRYGAHIERLFGTILQQVHSLPGTTFSSVAERGQYDSEGNAIMTESEFEHWFLLFITGVYHQKVHSGIGTSPIKQYERGILGTDEIPGRGLPRKITDEDRLILDLMPYYTRRIQEYGVSIEKVHYFGDVLRRYVKTRDPQNPRKKREFVFKRSPKDISLVYFFDPEIKEYFRIPYRDTSKPPMTVWEWRRAERKLIEQGMKNPSEELIFESYAAMRALVENAANETKRQRRERQQREDNKNAPKPKTADDLPISDTSNRNSNDNETLPVVPPFPEMEEIPDWEH